MPTKADGVTVDLDSTWTENMVSGKAKNEVQVLDVDSAKWNKNRSKENQSTQLAPREVPACGGLHKCRAYLGGPWELKYFSKYFLNSNV